MVLKQIYNDILLVIFSVYFEKNNLHKEER